MAAAQLASERRSTRRETLSLCLTATALVLRYDIRHQTITKRLGLDKKLEPVHWAEQSPCHEYSLTSASSSCCWNCCSSHSADSCRPCGNASKQNERDGLYDQLSSKQESMVKIRGFLRDTIAHLFQLRHWNVIWALYRMRSYPSETLFLTYFWATERCNSSQQTMVREVYLMNVASDAWTRWTKPCNYPATHRTHAAVCASAAVPSVTGKHKGVNTLTADPVHQTAL